MGNIRGCAHDPTSLQRYGNKNLWRYSTVFAIKRKGWGLLGLCLNANPVLQASGVTGWFGAKTALTQGMIVLQILAVASRASDQGIGPHRVAGALVKAFPMGNG